MYYIVSFLISAGAIFFVANSGYITGISLANGYVSALMFAVVLAVVNLLLGTILRIITFPLKLITLGAISLIVSLIIVKITDELVPTVTLSGWLPIVVIAIIPTIVSTVMKMVK